MSDVTLSAATRSTLLSLQSTLNLLNRTNNRLATGNAVNGATDNAVKYFSAQSLNNRANDLANRKDQIGQSISLLTATQNGLDAVSSTLSQIRGLVVQAQSASSTVAQSISNQIDTLAAQLINVVQDSSYQGQNLINSTGFSLTVQFSTATTSTLTISSRSLLLLSQTGAGNTAGLFSTGLSTGALSQIEFSNGVSNFFDNLLANGATAASTAFGDTLSTLRDSTQYAANSGASAFTTALAAIDGAIATVQAQAATFGGNNTFLSTRLNFTSSYSNTLTAGAGKLTLADINQEGANSVALQTRQQLGIQALAFTGQSDRSVLTLFR